MTPNEIRIALGTMPARVVLALTVFAEASGEPELGQVAVAWVVKHRAARWRQTIQLVCLAPRQFSCWWGTDPNSARLYQRAEAVLLGASPGLQDPAWLSCAAACHRALIGTAPDPTGGALYYCTAAILTDPRHANEWYARQVRAGVLVETVRIGHHVFHTERT